MKPLVKIKSILTSWWLNGKLHREDGPAVEQKNGDKMWYVNGLYVSKEKYAKAVKAMKK